MGQQTTIINLDEFEKAKQDLEKLFRLNFKYYRESLNNKF